MNSIIEWIDTLNGFVYTYILIILLVGVGLYFTVKTNFIQFRMFPEMFRVITEKSETENGVSAFQAFSISAASRVGAANIAGVAMAIAAGGPGAVFWMWVVAIIGMATGLIESLLAQIYKVKDGDNFRGGPAYYIQTALGKKWLAVLFAVLISITFGLIFNSLQANTLANALGEAFEFNPLIVGVIVALLTGVIIFGGVQRISKITSIIVPVMAIFYVAVVGFVVFTNITLVPSVLGLIVTEAFGFREAGVGILIGALVEGARRGLFSNEAGMGSVPHAAAAAHVSHPVKQGLVQSLGVFFDTIIICSATAFAILLSDVYKNGAENGVALTQASLSEHLGSWAVGFVAIAIFFFAFSSLIGNYYYGESNIQFIKNGTIWLQAYRIAVMIMIVVGSYIEIGLAWGLADIFMAVTAAVNLVVILLISKVAFAAIKDYQQQRKAGKDPVFYQKNIPGLKGADTWVEEKESDK
ncbi:alanine/glycine:cation symporter family protein [Alkalicoccobacillus murimartini]|uniref:AGCS family alanine or glycine:cation symporter n=1 Tax=Alkalicoccobacillus murimartini TaxID=171685 RepID=A0ABT9YMB4_9BACI|nr:alanine/glycine:cation symporter family protein [Alkalicoccobacillus murimartini]MDQ0209017.1 AGCS family alanine or glycine:cation symporter [Alkalicoccobacillus murimartini]